MRALRTREWIAASMASCKGVLLFDTVEFDTTKVLVGGNAKTFEDCQ